MSTSSEFRQFLAVGVAAIVVTVAPVAARAQTTPDSENGRYSFSQTADGVLRLDTRTGGVSSCSKREAAGWACYTVPDERAALDAEIGRLQDDNNRLKAELAKRDVAEGGSKTDAQLPKEDSLKKGEAGKSGAGKSNRIELPLPDDQDIDRVIAFLERAWRRLVEAANRMQRDVSGKI